MSSNVDINEDSLKKAHDEVLCIGKVVRELNASKSKVDNELFSKLCATHQKCYDIIDSSILDKYADHFSQKKIFTTTLTNYNTRRRNQITMAYKHRLMVADNEHKIAKEEAALKMDVVKTKSIARRAILDKRQAEFRDIREEYKKARKDIKIQGERISEECSNLCSKAVPFEEGILIWERYTC